MPRFFFHVQHRETALDTEGLMLTDKTAARDEAVSAAGEMLRELDGDFWRDPTWRMWVTDEAGANVCSLVFSVEDLG